MSDPFDMDAFVNAASDDLGAKHAAARGVRVPVREVFARALGRAQRDARGSDFRDLKAKARTVLEGSPEDGGVSSRVVLPPGRRTR